MPGWNYAPRSADGTWDLAAGRRSLEASITEGLKRRAACAWLLESVYYDAADLWRCFKAARERVDEMDISTSIPSPRDERLEHFADNCNKTPLRKLILQKLGTVPPPVCRLTRQSVTITAEWVRGMGTASSFREHINKVVEDHCVAADQEVEPLPGDAPAFAPPTHEQVAARDKLYRLFAAIYPPDARRRALALRGRAARDPIKLTPADLLEIAQRAKDWPAPSPIFRTYGKVSYSYIFQAPVSLATIVMLREADEEAWKASEARLAVPVAEPPEEDKAPVWERKRRGEEEFIFKCH